MRARGDRGSGYPLSWSWTPGSGPGSGQQSRHHSPRPGRTTPAPTGRSCADVWKSLTMHLIWNNRKLKRLSQVCVLASQISSGILVKMDQKWPYPVKWRNPCYPRSIKFQLSKVLTCTDLLYNSITAVHSTVLYTWKIKRTDLLIRTLWVFLPKLKKENAKKNKKNLYKDRVEEETVPLDSKTY